MCLINELDNSIVELTTMHKSYFFQTTNGNITSLISLIVIDQARLEHELAKPEICTQNESSSRTPAELGANTSSSRRCAHQQLKFRPSNFLMHFLL